MLYVSRMVDRSHVCVTDSDDGVEDVLTASELIKYTRDLGLDIKGVSVFRGKGGRYKVSASVYQPMETVSTTQTKHKVLSGVDVKVSGSTITSIQWPVQRDDHPVSIRLSNFGTSCADYIFWWKGLTENRNLTIILDDKIKATGKSFKYLSIIGVKFDLREVKNEKLATLVYKAFMATHGNRGVRGERFPVFIQDDLNRLRYWQAVYYLDNEPLSWNDHKEVFHDEQIAARIYKEFAGEFKAISECEFYLNSKDSESERSWYIRRKYYDIDPDRDDDFDYMRRNCMPDLFNLIANYTTCNSGVVTRFKNYIMYFDVPKDIQEAFIKFARNAHDFLYRFHEDGY